MEFQEEIMGCKERVRNTYSTIEQPTIYAFGILKPM